MDKLTLQNTVAEIRDGWDAKIDELGTTGLEQPAGSDGWRVRDVIAHFNAWERWQLVQLRCMFSGETPSDEELTGGIVYPDNDDLQEDAMNAMFLAGTKDLPTEEILRHWNEVNAMRSSFLDGLSQEQLDATMGADWAGGNARILRLASEVPGVSNPEPLWTRLLDQVEHQRAHLNELA